MLTVRKSNDRGLADYDWLRSRHTFSFGDYYDPAHMGFRALRVINEDRVVPGEGFPTHGHRDMEIISYVLEGALEHKDSIGTGSVIRPGEIQRMTAGTGIRHSEYNASQSVPVHFLQIWIEPERTGLAPGYEQKTLANDGPISLIASRDGGPGCVTVHQDVRIYRVQPAPDAPVVHDVPPNRHVWVQLVRGSVTVNGAALEVGDGAAIQEESQLSFLARGSGSELILFDLA